MLYFPPDFLKALLLSPPKTEALALAKAHEALKEKFDKQAKQLENMTALNETLRKKASAVTLDGNTVTPPAYQTKFSSWAEYQAQHKGAVFSAYREAQVEFLHGELDKLDAFLKSLNQ